MAFNPKQIHALCILAAGGSSELAARTAGVSVSCIEKWRRKPDFKKALRDAVDQTYQMAISELVLGSQLAARELRQIITSPETSDRVKITAIQTLLSTAEKCRQWHLESRLERIEELISGNDGEQTQEH